MTYRAIPCPCGHRACTSWMVDPVAAVQGVRFTQAQAEAVAALLNTLDVLEARHDFVDNRELLRLLGIDKALEAVGWEPTERLGAHHISEGWAPKLSDSERNDR